MGTYIIRRVLLMIPTVFLISVLTFFVVELPPGDFASRYAEALQAQGLDFDDAVLEGFRELYHLNDPTVVRYFNRSKRIAAALMVPALLPSRCRRKSLPPGCR